MSPGLGHSIYLLALAMHALHCITRTTCGNGWVWGSREAGRTVVGSEVAIHELHEDLSDSDESNATDANDYMHAAGMQVARANTDCDNMIMALNNMVCLLLKCFSPGVLHLPKRVLFLGDPPHLLMEWIGAAQLNRPDVQKVVLSALLEDPTVQDLIMDRNRVCLALMLSSSVAMGVRSTNAKRCGRYLIAT